MLELSAVCKHACPVLPALTFIVHPALPSRSGVYNDLGSGSNVDVCVITQEGVDYMRNHQYLQVGTAMALC